MKTDDKLLRDFFACNKKEVADGGFSRQVMEKLSPKISPWAQIWSVCLVLAAFVLFFAFNGLHGIIETLRDIFVSIVQYSVINIDLYSTVIAILVLLFLGIRKVWTIEP